MTYSRNDFISNRAWLRYFVSDKEIVLRGVSALEYLGFFVGYFGEYNIEVYAKTSLPNDNIKCELVNDYSLIDYTRHGKVLCSSFEQAVNDLLADTNSDDQALTEALSNYYYSHKESFDGLHIRPENIAEFENIRESAIAYYCGG